MKDYKITNKDEQHQGMRDTHDNRFTFQALRSLPSLTL